MLARNPLAAIGRRADFVKAKGASPASSVSPSGHRTYDGHGYHPAMWTEVPNTGELVYSG